VEGGNIMDEQNNKCEKENLIRQLVKVQAQVTVTPDVRHGPPKVTCLDSCIKPNYCSFEEDYYDCRYYNPDCCDRDRCWHNLYNCNYESNYDDYCCGDFDYDSTLSNGRCNYTLTQIICIEIPISMDADIDIKEGILCCGEPEILPVDDTSEKTKHKTKRKKKYKAKQKMEQYYL